MSTRLKAPPLWHVHFDGLPQVLGHICGEHRSAGDLLDCGERDADGNCPHVQLYACDCDQAEACGACALGE